MGRKKLTVILLILILLLGGLAIFLAITINNRNVNPEETSASEGNCEDEDTCVNKFVSQQCQKEKSVLQNCLDKRSEKIRECERVRKYCSSVNSNTSCEEQRTQLLNCETGFTKVQKDCAEILSRYSSCTAEDGFGNCTKNDRAAYTRCQNSIREYTVDCDRLKNALDTCEANIKNCESANQSCLSQDLESTCEVEEQNLESCSNRVSQLNRPECELQVSQCRGNTPKPGSGSGGSGASNGGSGGKVNGGTGGSGSSSNGGGSSGSSEANRSNTDGNTGGNTGGNSGTNTKSSNTGTNTGNNTGNNTSNNTGNNTGGGGGSTGERCGNIVCGPGQYCSYINDGIPECCPVGVSCERPKCGNVRCGSGQYCSYANGVPECCEVGKDCTRNSPPSSGRQSGSGNRSGGGSSSTSNSGSSSNSGNSVTNTSGGSSTPSSTPTPDPRPDLCQSATISRSTLGPGESLTITSTAKTNNIKSFTYGFYNLDNLYGPDNPKPIYFQANTHYIITEQVNSPKNSHTITINFNQLNRPDLNWNGRVPSYIQVNAYFTHTDGRFSRPDQACVVKFRLMNSTQNQTSSGSSSQTSSGNNNTNSTENQTSSGSSSQTLSGNENMYSTQSSEGNNGGRSSEGSGSYGSGSNGSNLPDTGIEDMIGVFVSAGIALILISIFGFKRLMKKRFEDRVLR